MTERIHNVTRAICKQADGSRTDGKKMFQLPIPVMSFTNYCEALSRAFNCDYDFHKVEIIKSESKGRLVIEYIIRFDKNRTSIQNEINVLLYKARELASSRLKS